MRMIYTTALIKSTPEMEKSITARGESETG